MTLLQSQVEELSQKGLLPADFPWDKVAETVTVFLRARGLPQGFRNSCAVWTKLSRVLTAHWRRRGVKLVHLLDDLLFSISGTHEEACVVRDSVLSDLKTLHQCCGHDLAPV